MRLSLLYSCCLLDQSVLYQVVTLSCIQADDGKSEGLQVVDRSEREHKKNFFHIVFQFKLQAHHIVFQDFPRQVPQLTRGSRNLTRISPNIIPNFRPTFEINQTEPESQNYYPVASNIVIKVLLLNLPQAHQNLPQVHQKLPQVHQNLPQVRQIQGIFLG